MRGVYALFLWCCMTIPVMAGDSPVAGKSLYEASCASCHGTRGEGNEALQSPALAGQQVAYLVRQLEHFANGVRGADERDTAGGQMVAMASLVKDDAARRQVSEYLGSLPVIAVEHAPGDPRIGYQRYQASCGSCHGPDGEGNERLNSPRLAGLRASYLRRQHHNFTTGIRGVHSGDKFGRQMKMMAATVTDPVVLDDIIAYLTSRH